MLLVVSVIRSLFDINSSFSCSVDSATYNPKELIVYYDWENGHSRDNWTVAACNTYSAIDLKQSF